MRQESQVSIDCGTSSCLPQVITTCYDLGWCDVCEEKRAYLIFPPLEMIHLIVNRRASLTGRYVCFVPFQHFMYRIFLSLLGKVPTLYDLSFSHRGIFLCIRQLLECRNGFRMPLPSYSDPIHAHASLRSVRVNRSHVFSMVGLVIMWSLGHIGEDEKKETSGKSGRRGETFRLA